MIEIDKIYNMDCMDGLKQIADKSVSLVVTDPPYLHTKGHGGNHKTHTPYKNGHSKFATSALYDNSGFMMNGMNYFDEALIEKCLDELVRVCKIPNIYLFCNETQVPLYANYANNHNLMFSILVWEKPLSIINKNKFSQNIEFIVRIYDLGTGLNRLPLNMLYNRVKKDSPVAGVNKIHPTEKPVSIVEQFILLSSKEGDLILDPFIGSGTTAIASRKNKRHYIGFEISNEYFNIAQKRIISESRQLTLF